MDRALAAALAGLALAGSAALATEEQKPAMRSTDQPRPRDGDVAIRQELDAARRARTLAAYDLFLARHPSHPLADVARRERAALGPPPRP
jgi:hypothetical protein